MPPGPGPDQRRALRAGEREIHYRRLDAQVWSELPAKFQAIAADNAELLARLPSDLAPGIYVFRADAVDTARNTASTSRRANGTKMTVRKVAPDPSPRSSGSRRATQGAHLRPARLRRACRQRADRAVQDRGDVGGRLVDEAGAASPAAPSGSPPVPGAAPSAGPGSTG